MSKHHPNAGWTDARVALLKRLWSDGLSVSMIAAELGGLTRNAVVGKVHRLGLPGRQRPRQSHEEYLARRRVREAKYPKRAVEARPPKFTGDVPVQFVEAPAPAALVPFLELRSEQCRWPIGDPRHMAEFGFCGAPQWPDRVYCAHHCRMAYETIHERRQSKRAA